MSVMTCTGAPNCVCGCCSGVAVETPRGESNPPGLSAIAYRTGVWSSFKNSMRARLSSFDYPALAGLKTRADDDFSIALLDASAVMLDILTFYQERLANEGYLRTATQLYSLTQLSRLIGYQPSPGVSASAYVAFTLSSAPGAPPNTGNAAIVIPAGVAVQSIPVQGQAAQAFETAADILGKPEWNALPVQTGLAWAPGDSPTSVWLAGAATGLSPGDPFLIVAQTSDPKAANWPTYFGTVQTVAPDAVNQRTLVTWTASGAKFITGALSAGTATFYAMRQRASLFGFSAINPVILTSDIIGQLRDAGLITTTDPAEWRFGIQTVGDVDLGDHSLVDLDSVYPKITAPGWVVLMAPNPSSSPPWGIFAAAIQGAMTTTRSDYGVSGKITRLQLAATNFPVPALLLHPLYARTRSVAVLAQSEALPAAEQPLDHPLYGTLVDLEGVREDLAGVTAVAIIGKRQKVTLKPGVALSFQPYDSPDPEPANPGDVFTLLKPPTAFTADGAIPPWTGSTSAVKLVVADGNGRGGVLACTLGDFTLTASDKHDPVAQEIGLVSRISLAGQPNATRTRIVLQTRLINCYERAATSVNANVGVATAGRSVTELLGSGQSTTPNQAFKLKQAPLTYTQAKTPNGRQSSLKVLVNGAAWTAEPSLYAQPSMAQVYTSINNSDGTATVQFGDGVEGALLPTGSGNVMADYRVGLGAAGNVAAGAIATLVDRPLGVSGVSNPMAATGGQDRQSVDALRANAPQTVQTLGRAVSITDYQSFAATFAGIGKAYALWIPNGPNRGVFVTVAAASGQALSPTDITLLNLTAALTGYGNPQIRVQVQSFYETLFGLSADIAYDPRYDPKATQAAVMARLTSTYSFANRDFGQGVSGDEIDALIQGVPGVVAVNVKSLTIGPTSSAGDLGRAGYSVAAYDDWLLGQQTLYRPDPCSATRICPYTPAAQIGALPAPADLLVLNPDPSSVTLGVMS